MDINDFVKVRRHLHQHPELSSLERDTSDYIKSYFEVNCSNAQVTKIGDTSLLVRFPGTGSSKTVMLRCELDALQIQESNKFTYRSVVDNVSHKCGHDGHMTILMRVGFLVDKHPTQGDVLLLFQSAEENGKGAIEVLKDENFQNISDIDYIYALHNIPGEPMHNIFVKQGPFSSAVISLEIQLKGITSHAGEPEKGINPSYALSDIWQNALLLQKELTIAPSSHIITPIHATVGSRDFGISAGFAKAGFTLRTKNNVDLEVLKDRFLEAITQVCNSHNIEMQHEWIEEFPSIINDKDATQFINKTAESLQHELTTKTKPFSWGEDFGHFTKQYKGAMFGLGSGIETPALHNPNFDFPDELIKSGSDFFVELIQNTQHA